MVGREGMLGGLIEYVRGELTMLDRKRWLAAAMRPISSPKPSRMVSRAGPKNLQQSIRHFLTVLENAGKNSCASASTFSKFIVTVCGNAQIRIEKMTKNS